MTNSLMTVDANVLAFLSRQMKATVLDFATGKRDAFAPFGGPTLEIALGFLSSVERAADSRGLDRAGSEWGPQIDEIRSLAHDTLDTPAYRR